LSTVESQCPRLFLLKFKLNMEEQVHAITYAIPIPVIKRMFVFTVRLQINTWAFLWIFIAVSHPTQYHNFDTGERGAG
jgi:hypothetical protein